jgi:hypothetical protein
MTLTHCAREYNTHMVTCQRVTSGAQHTPQIREAIISCERARNAVYNTASIKTQNFCAHLARIAARTRARAHCARHRRRLSFVDAACVRTQLLNNTHYGCNIHTHATRTRLGLVTLSDSSQPEHALAIAHSALCEQHERTQHLAHAQRW